MRDRSPVLIRKDVEMRVKRRFPEKVNFFPEEKIIIEDGISSRLRHILPHYTIIVIKRNPFVNGLVKFSQCV
jgi:hypothetical protein